MEGIDLDRKMGLEDKTLLLKAKTEVGVAKKMFMDTIDKCTEDGIDSVSVLIAMSFILGMFAQIGIHEAKELPINEVMEQSIKMGKEKTIETIKRGL